MQTSGSVFSCSLKTCLGLPAYKSCGRHSHNSRIFKSNPIWRGNIQSAWRPTLLTAYYRQFFLRLHSFFVCPVRGVPSRGQFNGFCIHYLYSVYPDMVIWLRSRRTKNFDFSSVGTLPRPPPCPPVYSFRKSGTIFFSPQQPNFPICAALNFF